MGVGTLWMYLIEIAKVELGDRQLTPVCELPVIECPQHLSAVTVTPKKRSYGSTMCVTNDVSVRRLGYNCAVYLSQQLTNNVTRTWNESRMRSVRQGCGVANPLPSKVVS
jgi:hypothetical protein